MKPMSPKDDKKVSEGSFKGNDMVSNAFLKNGPFNYI
jgi:hypothetical protein